MTDELFDQRTIYEEIVDLLRDEGPLSTHQITERLNNKGVRVNGNGQTLNRLRNLERREAVERIPGDRPGWKRWRLTEV